MPFSQEKLDQVRAGIERSLASGSLNDWERKFLLDMRSRLQRDGRKTMLSDKQYRKLMQLAGGSPKPATAPAPLTKQKANTRVSPPSSKPRKATTPHQHYYRRRRPSFRRSVREATYAVAALGTMLILAITIFSPEPAPTPRTTPQPVPSSSSTTAAKAISGRSITVIDGDTVRVPGDSRRVRLVGFNTPEVFSPKCERELQLGQQASQRLRELLTSAGTVEYERVACACKPGTEGTEACNFGRICGVLRVDGVDVEQILISEGLAARYRCGRTSCPPPPGNWCR